MNLLIGVIVLILVVWLIVKVATAVLLAYSNKLNRDMDKQLRDFIAGQK